MDDLLYSIVFGAVSVAIATFVLGGFTWPLWMWLV